RSRREPPLVLRSPPPPSSTTLFPYTTLFRSRRGGRGPSPSRTWLPTASSPAGPRRGISRRSRARRWRRCGSCSPIRACRRRDTRSEEHTSELQSHLNFVCRLLLEKITALISALAGLTLIPVHIIPIISIFSGILTALSPKFNLENKKIEINRWIQYIHNSQ